MRFTLCVARYKISLLPLIHYRRLYIVVFNFRGHKRNTAMVAFDYSVFRIF